MRLILSKASLAIAALAMLPTAALAATIYQRTFIESHGGSSCYGRDYGPEEWRKNPNLKIGNIAVSREAKTLSQANSSSRRFGVRLDISTRSGAEYAALGECRPAGKHFSCTLESDGGDFRLLRVGRHLKLETRRIEIEGLVNNLEITSQRRGPTRSFTLYHEAGAPCDPG